MFRKKWLEDESGLILFTVIVIAIIVSALVVSLLGLSVSQSTRSRESIDSLKSEIVARGILYRYQQLQITGCPNPPCTISGNCATCSFPPQTIDGKIYTINVTNAGPTTLPGGPVTNRIDIQVTY
jgi:hypothetical protein